MDVKALLITHSVGFKFSKSDFPNSCFIIGSFPLTLIFNPPHLVVLPAPSCSLCPGSEPCPGRVPYSLLTPWALIISPLNLVLLVK